MERKRRSGDVKLLPYLTCRYPFSSGFHEQPEDREARFLGKCGEC